MTKINNNTDKYILINNCGNEYVIEPNFYIVTASDPLNLVPAKECVAVVLGGISDKQFTHADKPSKSLFLIVDSVKQRNGIEYSILKAKIFEKGDSAKAYFEGKVKF